MLKKRDGKSSMPSEAQVVAHLQRANEVAKLALANGFHPFGAILVAPNHTTVLLEQGNLDQVRHAESELVRRAFFKFSPAVLSRSPYPVPFSHTLSPRMNDDMMT